MKRNRLYRSDCKVVTEESKKEGIKVDLIYLDPPFNSNRTYSMIFNHRGITAQQKAYHDMWDFTDSTRQLVLDFRDELRTWDLPDSFKEFMQAWLRILEGGDSQDRKLLNYLMYMTQRLVRLKDLLAPNGSIYFHCDTTASHYIKVIMDGIFGRKNFRSEIIWKRTSAHSSAKRFGPVHDTILFYTVSDSYTWRRHYQPYDPQYVETFFDQVDDAGRRYKRGDLTGAGTRGGETGHPWRGIDITAKGRHWAYLPDTLDELDGQGKLHWPAKKGGMPRLKQFEDESKGVPLQDVWTDIKPLHNLSRERLGYQTQKPLALLKRIIEASTDEGDTVLDPFCGCGTTIEAAHTLGRRWIGIDISGDAVDEIKDRLAALGVFDYDTLEGNPDTMAEYNRLNPFEKQDWLIRRLGGLPNPKKSGDRGIDGDMTFHVEADKKGNDTWGQMIFSVKTGKQRSPAHVRELCGTMKNENAQMGVLILDCDPTSGMENAADKAGRFSYQQILRLPPKSYDRVQIITAHEIIDGAKVDCPPTMQAVKRYRKAQTEMRI